MEHLGQLHEAISARAWSALLDEAARLIARGDEGVPPGHHAHWASVAAGRMGKWYDAVFYARHASAVAGAGTDLEARALCNLAYFSVQYGAPESALSAGTIFLQRADQYSPRSRELTPRVLQHLASARELLGQWADAAQLFREAAAMAKDPAIREIALIDAAYAELKQGPHRGTHAAEALAQVTLAHLNERGRFAYHVVEAQLLHMKGDVAGSDAAVQAALEAANQVEEPLARELAMVKLVQAQNALTYVQQGAGAHERNRALALGFEATLSFQQQHQIALYEEGREFLRKVLDAR